MYDIYIYIYIYVYIYIYIERERFCLCFPVCSCWFSMIFHCISESVFLLAVSLDSGVTVGLPRRSCRVPAKRAPVDCPVHWGLPKEHWNIRTTSRTSRTTSRTSRSTSRTSRSTFRTSFRVVLRGFRGQNGPKTNLT